MFNRVTIVCVKSDKLGRLGRYETVGDILNDVVHAAWSVLEKKLTEDLSDDAVKLQSVEVKVEERINSAEDDESPSVNEADIEKKIKDFRRISENQIAGKVKDRIESGIGEAYFSPDSSRSSTNSVQLSSDMNNECVDTFDEAASVDMEDRHWKRRHCKSMKRTLESPLSDFSFSNIQVSPVIKLSRMTESFSDASILFSDASCPVSLSSVGSSSPLLSSTPSLAASTAWSVTESVPPILWSDARGLEKIDETSEDAECLKEIIKDQEFGENVDLREILKHRKCSRSSSSVVSVSGIDTIKVTVGKETGVRRVEDNSFDNKNELEEGEIMNISGSIKSKEINSNYNKILLSDLLEKKRVLEHLIDMVNREESGQDETKLSVDEVSFESSTSDDVPYMYDAIEEPSSRRVVEELTRRVVYRNSPTAEDQTRNVLNDFNSEMDKGLRNMFPMNENSPGPQVSIKLEPASDDVAATAKHSSRSIHVSKSGKFECNLCNVTCLSSQRSMKEHMKGRKHQLNLDANYTRGQADGSCINKVISCGWEGSKVDFSSKCETDNKESMNEPKIVKSEPTDLRSSPKHGHGDSTVIIKPMRKKIIWDLK